MFCKHPVKLINLIIVKQYAMHIYSRAGSQRHFHMWTNAPLRLQLACALAKATVHLLSSPAIVFNACTALACLQTSLQNDVSPWISYEEEAERGRCAGLLKSSAVRGGARDVVLDERIAVGLDLMSASVPTMLRLLYPSLYAVHDPQGSWGTPNQDGRYPPPPPSLHPLLPCSSGDRSSWPATVRLIGMSTSSEMWNQCESKEHEFVQSFASSGHSRPAKRASYRGSWAIMLTRKELLRSKVNKYSMYVQLVQDWHAPSLSAVHRCFVWQWCISSWQWAHFCSLAWQRNQSQLHVWGKILSASTGDGDKFVLSFHVNLPAQSPARRGVSDLLSSKLHARTYIWNCPEYILILGFQNVLLLER